VQCLDVLRTISKTPQAVDVFFQEVDKAKGANTRLDRWSEAFAQGSRGPDRVLQPDSLFNDHFDDHAIKAIAMPTAIQIIEIGRRQASLMTVLGKIPSKSNPANSPATKTTI